MIETVQEEKEELQAENDAIGEEIEELNTQLTALKEEYYAKTAALDEVKKTASKTSKMLEASLKEISTWVRALPLLLLADEMRELGIDGAIPFPPPPIAPTE